MDNGSMNLNDAKKGRWSPSGQVPDLSTLSLGGAGGNGSNDMYSTFGAGQFNGNGFASTASGLQQSTMFPNTLGAGLDARSSGLVSSGTATSSPSVGQNPAANFGNFGMMGLNMPNLNLMQQQLSQNGLGSLSQTGRSIPNLNLSIPNGGQATGTGSTYSPAQMTPSILNGLPSSMGSAFPMSATGLGNMANAAAFSMNANQQGLMRTVYIGSLPATATVDELLNLVHFGPLENIRVLPEKNCVFLSFLDPAAASAFHASATAVNKLVLGGQELKVGWGKPSPLPREVIQAVSQSGASRNVYLGNLPEDITEEALRDDLARFGFIDQVKLVKEKNIGFVHFLSISTAIKVVAQLPNDPAWAGRRVNYGKDRCAYVSKTQQAQQAATAQSLMALNQLSSPTTAFSPAAMFGQTGLGSANAFSPTTALSTANLFSLAGLGGGFGDLSAIGAGGFGGLAAASQASMNRTVYIGNIHPDTTLEELCNNVRGGVVQSIRFIQDKHIAFVTFVDGASAFTFHQAATFSPISLSGRRLKVGWGKAPGALPPNLALAVHGGATRNVYVGNITDWDTYTEEKLRRDFEEWGEIELVNFLKEKNCAFVNFTNIQSAIKAIESIKSKPEYSLLKVAHGKDRCANAPRIVNHQSMRNRNLNNGMSNHGMTPVSAVPIPTDDELHAESFDPEQYGITAE